MDHGQRLREALSSWFFEELWDYLYPISHQVIILEFYVIYRGFLGKTIFPCRGSVPTVGVRSGSDTDMTTFHQLSP